MAESVLCICGYVGQVIFIHFARENETPVRMNGQNMRGRIRLVSLFVSIELCFLFHSRGCI